MEIKENNNINGEWIQAAIFSMYNGIGKTMETFDLSYSCIKYGRRKRGERVFHPQSHGGRRNNQLDNNTRMKLARIIGIEGYGLVLQNYIIEAVTGYLKAGDTLILDNATVHANADTFPVIEEFLKKKTLVLDSCQYIARIKSN
ncbi:hypothetical protein ACTFIR_007496 [Dictyostelium discoideum]